MNKLNLIPILIVLLSLSFSYSFAQNKEEEIFVVQPYEPTISDAFKINENPKIVDTTVFKPNLSYGINSKIVGTDYKVEPISPAKMVGEPLTKLYKFFAKGGFGNYSTPYLEVFANNLRSSKYSFGAHAKHMSSNMKLKYRGATAYSENVLNVYGRKFLKSHTISADINFNRNVLHHYGFDTRYYTNITKSDIRQRFSCFSVNGDLLSTYRDTIKIYHNIKLNYYNLSDIYKTQENGLKLSGSASKYQNIFKELNQEKLNLESAVDFDNTHNNTGNFNNAIITLKPSVFFKVTDFNFRVGLNAALDVDTNTSIHLYPLIDASMSVASNFLIFYVGLSGDMKKNNYKNYTDENPFVSSNILLTNTNEKFNAFGGFRGTLSSEITFNLKASYSKIGNMPFYVNFPGDSIPNMFEVVYDDVKQLNVHGEIAYQQTEKLKIVSSLYYYNYEMTKESQAWHKPSLEFNLGAHYNIKDKIIARFDLIAFDHHYVKTYGNLIPDGKDYMLIRDMVDVNLGVEYRYNKVFSAFLNLNNIANSRYYKWNHYQMQKFNFLAGLTYAF